ncbi:MAG: ABC transporter ATP-binding protein [Sphaerochaetaceae bacterium]|jgi:putative ABC transport system ATP-binding protein|nr:ABC transporter ATP-binding protein [Sphaerochaetaceae bacterium]NLO61157.1 ABC transporter ATP-binding protein [Spirochaetales bacterium]MDD2405962.1 ABC transporter ATP-binding protein [Sphaerochaetaceae bacterium]MDD3669863.1 ABC transporter ATP-binding protein [Sphaerochaetaceae bacterium]MDD4260144.1 ABC transporter ATP-binding protein [Sphaerochaetaceae bacterium]
MIRVEQVDKTYHTGDSVVRALRNVSMHIPDGQFISIAGPSGSGKTTLLNLIGCIDSVDKGEIWIDDKAVSTLGKHGKTEFRRSHLGFIFQTYNLIPVLTAYENVAFVLSILSVPEEEIKERTLRILEEVGLKGMEQRRPDKLSGGQQQRIAIARALIKHPKIVLADEPTANLDSKTGKEILALMKQMNQRYGTTFVFSTHDQMVMDYAGRLVQLHDGQIVSDDSRSTQ